MLFKDYHLPMIRSGSKTVTPREWSENYGRPTEGSIQIASDEMFTSDEDADCYIRIQAVYDQPLGEMADADAQAEGDYETLEEFRDGYEAVYGDGAWDPAKTVTVVEFEYVGRTRPPVEDPDQTTLVTDGGTDVERTNSNARYPTESDSRYPFGPDWEVVNAAIQRHRKGNREPVQIPIDDPATVVVP